MNVKLQYVLLVVNMPFSSPSPLQTSSISTVFWPRYWHISISLKTVRFGLKCFDSSRCVEGRGRSRDLVSTSKYNLQFYSYLHNAHNDSTLSSYIGFEPCFSH